MLRWKSSKLLETNSDANFTESVLQREQDKRTAR